LGDELYDLGKIHVRHAEVQTAIPITFWRALVFAEHFFLESFVDEWRPRQAGSAAIPAGYQS